MSCCFSTDNQGANTIKEIEEIDSDNDIELQEEKLKLKKIKVNLIFNLYSISNINCYSQTAIANFQIDFIYRKSDYLKYNFVPDDENELRAFPFILVNACGDYNIAKKITGDFIGNSVSGARLYARKQIPKDFTEVDDKDILYFESYHIVAEIKLINNLNYIPFNTVYAPINISTTGYHNTERVRFVNSAENSFKSSLSKRDSIFFSVPKWEMPSNTYSRMIVVENCKTEEQMIQYGSLKWPRAYYLLKYDFNPFEEIIKYFIIPTLFNNMLIMCKDN